MPEITDLFSINNSYSSDNWSVGFINVSICNNIKFTFFVNTTCDLSINWAFCDDGVIHYSEKSSYRSGSHTIKINPQNRFMQIVLDNFGTSPLQLKTQAFYNLNIISENIVSNVNNLPRINIENLPKSIFGSVKTESEITQIDYIHTYGTNGYLKSYLGNPTFSSPNPYLQGHTNTVGEPATVEFINSNICLGNIDNQINSPACISGMSVRYIAGIGVNCKFTGRFQFENNRDATNNGHTVQLLGIGSHQSSGEIYDGYFFGYGPDVASINAPHKFGIHHYRAGNLVQTIHQENWNTDNCDGNKTLPIMNWNDVGNVFRISYQYLGYGIIKFDVEDPVTGMFMNVHNIQYANANTVTNVDNPSMGMIMYMKALPTGIPLSNGDKIYSASFALAYEGTRNIYRPYLCVESNIVSVTGETHLLTIRNSSSFYSKDNKIPVLISFISASTDGSKSATLRIYLNKIITGTSFSSIDTKFSPIQFSTAGTLGLGGLKAAVFEMAKVDKISQIVEQFNVQLQPGDVLTFTGQSTSSNDMKVSVSFKNI
jgi:hypothetical protein